MRDFEFCGELEALDCSGDEIKTFVGTVFEGV
jgi:hypothetical protein